MSIWLKWVTASHLYSLSADAVDESLLDDIGNDGDRKPSTGPSWGTSRLPPSLVGSKSPPPTKSPSPSKSARSSKSVTPESSPVKVRCGA